MDVEFEKLFRAPYAVPNALERVEGGVWIGADDGVVSFFESERRVDFLTGHEFGQRVMEGVQG